jgi:hypothetical protein
MHLNGRAADGAFGALVSIKHSQASLAQPVKKNEPKTRQYSKKSNPTPIALGQALQPHQLQKFTD